jgi:hypothetical protein
MRRTLEPKSVVITSEDIGRPAENIEHYGGFPTLYVTDLERWHIRPSDASLAFITAGVRPYLLVPKPNPQEPTLGAAERARVLADLTAKGFVADRILQIPASRNMEYFVASPRGNRDDSELFRISHPKWEELLRSNEIQPGDKYIKPGA